jgi:hypothetical protein
MVGVCGVVVVVVLLLLPLLLLLLLPPPPLLCRLGSAAACAGYIVVQRGARARRQCPHAGVCSRPLASLELRGRAV